MEFENLSQEEIDKLQELILKYNTDNNPNLPSGQHETILDCIIASKRFQLDTSKKNVIQAINELLLKTKDAINVVDSFKERFNTIIGNEDAFNKERLVFTELRDKLGVQTLIKMVYNINKKIDEIEIPEKPDVCFLNSEDELNKIIDNLIEEVNGELIDWGKLRGFNLYYVPNR